MINKLMNNVARRFFFVFFFVSRLLFVISQFHFTDVCIIQWTLVFCESCGVYSFPYQHADIIVIIVLNGFAMNFGRPCPKPPNQQLPCFVFGWPWKVDKRSVDRVQLVVNESENRPFREHYWYDRHRKFDCMFVESGHFLYEFKTWIDSGNR